MLLYGHNHHPQQEKDFGLF